MMASLTAGHSRPLDLAGRVALVTGASRGIGRAIATALADAGAAMVLVDIRSCAETAAQIEAAGGAATCVTAGVEDRAQAAAAVDGAVATYGRLDILVNNAGVAERTPLAQVDDAILQRQVDVTLKGTLIYTQAVYETMRRQGGGKIVTISSVSALNGGAVSQGADAGRSGPAYAAVKAGVLGLTKWIAKEAGHDGITANAICPGPIETDMVAGFDYPVCAQPIARMGQPEDIAQVVLFLAGQMSNFMTGQVLSVDGGTVMS